jgi:hypothetical protein
MIRLSNLGIGQPDFFCAGEKKKAPRLNESGCLKERRMQKTKCVVCASHICLKTAVIVCEKSMFDEQSFSLALAIKH